MEHIEEMVIASPELAERYGKLGQLYDRRLWHQLTIALAEFVSDEGNRRGDSFVRLYSEFISKFEGKINQLELAKITGVIVRSFEDTEGALKFVDEMAGKKARLGPEGTLYLSILRLTIKLATKPAEEAAAAAAAAAGSGAAAAAMSDEAVSEETKKENSGVTTRAETLAEVKGVLAEKKAEVDALSGLMDTCVHSCYYELSTNYYKEAGPPEEYYKSALMLLAYTPLESMGKDKATALATDMCLAALSGEGIYNFGEVLATPIVSALEGTPNAWLGELLGVFNKGDIAGFALLFDARKAEFEAQPALRFRLAFLKEKLTLLALVNFIFQTPAQERTIPFTAVASHCQLPLDQVEWVAMKAMSLGLIKGSMDEVDQTLTVDFVQPRVLDESQMGHLSTRLGEWAEKVDETSKFIEGQTLDLGI